jgi:glutathione synthase
MKHILFIADPIESFKIAKDSTYAMMCAFNNRGHVIWFCEAKDVQHSMPRGVVAKCCAIEIKLGEHVQGDWFLRGEVAEHQLAEVDAVVLRVDPPFDAEYIYLTHLLEVAQRSGAKVFNDPKAVRNHPEKLSILEFPQFTAPTLVSRRADDIKAFHKEHQDIILKPLDGMGGMGIFRVKADGLNLGSIVETLNDDGLKTVMVQKFIPAIENGDKRILLIDGRVVPFSLARIPQGSEVRGNLAAGGLGVARDLTVREREIAESLGPELNSRGLFLVGLDVIGDYLTEINVTSPTCFQEITAQKGFDVAAVFVDALLDKIQGVHLLAPKTP